MPLRCLTLDDNANFLEAAADLLQREGAAVAGVTSSVADALRQARELRPDVILVDIMLGPEAALISPGGWPRGTPAALRSS